MTLDDVTPRLERISNGHRVWYAFPKHLIRETADFDLVYDAVCVLLKAKACHTVTEKARILFFANNEPLNEESKSTRN